MKGRGILQFRHVRGFRGQTITDMPPGCRAVELMYVTDETKTLILQDRRQLLTPDSRLDSGDTNGMTIVLI